MRAAIVSGALFARGTGVTAGGLSSGAGLLVAGHRPGKAPPVACPLWEVGLGRQPCREVGLHDEDAVAARGVDAAAGDGGAFAHADQAVPGAGTGTVPAGIGGAGDGDPQTGGLVTDGDLRMIIGAVLPGVRERLLQDSVGRPPPSPPVGAAPRRSGPR